jgi:hypothetical protein
MFSIRYIYRVYFCLIFICIHEPLADVALKKPIEKQIAQFPYPGQSMYIQKGLVGNVALGMESERYRGRFINLLRGQTEVSFYYTPFISGGVQAQISHGNLSDTTSQTSIRYIVVNRYHFPQKKWSFRVGPYFGVQDHELLEGGSSTGSLEVGVLSLRSPVFLVYGGEIGVGGLFTPVWGWTSGLSVEGLSSSGYAARLSLGGSWNGTLLRERWRNHTKGIMLYTELQLEWKDYAVSMNSPPRTWSASLVAGFAGAF